MIIEGLLTMALLVADIETTTVSAPAPDPTPIYCVVTDCGVECQEEGTPPLPCVVE